MWEKQTENIIVPCTTHELYFLHWTHWAPLEATVISMQEAKENFISDLIQDKSMSTHLFLTLPISSRRYTVLEFQGYPRCLCIGKAYLTLWDSVWTSLESCEGPEITWPRLLLSIYSARLWARSYNSISVLLSIHDKQALGSLTTVHTAFRFSDKLY